MYKKLGSYCSKHTCRGKKMVFSNLKEMTAGKYQFLWVDAQNTYELSAAAYVQRIFQWYKKTFEDSSNYQGNLTSLITRRNSPCNKFSIFIGIGAT